MTYKQVGDCLVSEKFTTLFAYDNSRLTSKHHDGVLGIPRDANLSIGDTELAGDSRNAFR